MNRDAEYRAAGHIVRRHFCIRTIYQDLGVHKRVELGDSYGIKERHYKSGFPF